MRFGPWLCITLWLCSGASLASAQQQKEVAITFDDLPFHGDLPATTTRLEIAKNIIGVLKEKGVPAVYGFVNAGNMKDDAEGREVLKAWVESGNLLGSHTYEHIDLSTTSAKVFEQNIAANESVLKAFMGQKDWHWFRYPYTHEGETLDKRHEVRKYLVEHGYKVAQVTFDFEDYAWNNPYARCVAKHDEKAIASLKSSYLGTAEEYISLDEKLARLQFSREIKNVLVLHIGAFDAMMLRDLLDLLTRKGFKFVTLEEAWSDPAYQADPDAPLKYGGTLLEQWMDGKHRKYPPHAEKPMEKLNAICR